MSRVDWPLTFDFVPSTHLLFREKSITNVLSVKKKISKILSGQYLIDQQVQTNMPLFPWGWGLGLDRHIFCKRLQDFVLTRNIALDASLFYGK